MIDAQQFRELRTQAQRIVRAIDARIKIQAIDGYDERIDVQLSVDSKPDMIREVLLAYQAKGWKTTFVEEGAKDSYLVSLHPAVIP